MTRRGRGGEDPLKEALARAQRRWPWTSEVASFLGKRKASEYLSDLRSSNAVRDRAQERSLSEEGLVLTHRLVPEGVPIIPPVAVQDDMPAGMLWEGRKTLMRTTMQQCAFSLTALLVNSK